MSRPKRSDNEYIDDEIRSGTREDVIQLVDALKRRSKMKSRPKTDERSAKSIHRTRR